MKVSQKDKDVVFAAQLRADQPITVFAKELGYKEHTVRHTLNKLKDAGLISPYPVINLFLLGLQEYAVYFSVSAKSGKKDALLKKLRRCERISILVELVGDYQYFAVILAEGVKEFYDIFSSLLGGQENTINHKAISQRLMVAVTPRHSLSSKRTGAKSIVIENRSQVIATDQTDRDILSCLASTPDLSYRAIGRKLGIQEGTIISRIKKLKSNKILAGFSLGMRAPLDGATGYRLLVATSSISSTFTKKLFNYCEKQGLIHTFIQCVGRWDYEILLCIDDTRYLTNLIADMNLEFADMITSIKVLTESCYHKLSYYICPGTDPETD